MKKYKIELLSSVHNKSEFSSSEASLNNYLHRQATQDIKRNLAVVYVLIELENPNTIQGFYTISSSSIALKDFPQIASKKLPRYPSIPVTLLGRLAIDTNSEKQGLGALLLIDALKRSTLLSKEIGFMAVVVGALNENAAQFYEKYGFIRFTENNKLFLTIETIKKLYL